MTGQRRHTKHQQQKIVKDDENALIAIRVELF